MNARPAPRVIASAPVIRCAIYTRGVACHHDGTDSATGDRDVQVKGRPPGLERAGCESRCHPLTRRRRVYIGAAVRQDKKRPALSMMKRAGRISVTVSPTP